MGDVTEQLTGILPIMVVAGVATKMTQSLFGEPNAITKKKKKKKGLTSPQAFFGGSSPF